MKDKYVADMKDKYIACMVLHAAGDAIGFKNGEWEFMISLDKVFEFIDLGGINHLSLDGWIVSDDTILHMKTAQGLLEKYNSINTLCEILKEKYLEAYLQFEQEGFEYRYPGNTTLRSLTDIQGGKKWTDISYNIRSGGSGASMRNPCIGLVYYGKENRDKLVQVSIESSRITHNSVIGYLGGLASALFVALAIENVDLKKWPFELLEMLKDGGIVSKYIETAGRDVIEYKRDVHMFIDKWDRYVKDKFDKNGNVIKIRSNINLILRSRYYYDSFGDKEEKGNKTKVFPGSGGDDSVIIAYDCLLDAGNSWEKLVFYSMLHVGDTDTTGCIAGALWGITRGFEDIPNGLLKHLEFKNELEEIGKNLYEKFHR